LQQNEQVFLPVIERAEPTPVVTLPADDPTNCPCGWFDADYRMVDFVAGP